MARYCPVIGSQVVYLACMECEENCSYAKLRKSYDDHKKENQLSEQNNSNGNILSQKNENRKAIG